MEMKRYFLFHIKKGNTKFKPALCFQLEDTTSSSTFTYVPELDNAIDNPSSPKPLDGSPQDDNQWEVYLGISLVGICILVAVFYFRGRTLKWFRKCCGSSKPNRMEPREAELEMQPL